MKRLRRLWDLLFGPARLIFSKGTLLVNGRPVVGFRYVTLDPKKRTLDIRTPEGPAPTPTPVPVPEYIAQALLELEPSRR